MNVEQINQKLLDIIHYFNNWLSFFFSNIYISILPVNEKLSIYNLIFFPFFLLQRTL